MTSFFAHSIHCPYLELYFKLCVIMRKPQTAEPELLTRGKHQGGGRVGKVETAFQGMVNTRTKQTRSNKLRKSASHPHATTHQLMVASGVWAGLPPQRARQGKQRSSRGPCRGLGAHHTCDLHMMFLGNTWRGP